MTVLIVFAILLAIVGIIGSIVPGIPGPPLSWIGMLLVYFADKGGDPTDPMSTTTLLIWLAITVIVTVLDYIIPVEATRVAGGHKAASTGAVIGLVAGMFFTPIGVVTGALLGAFLGELLVTDKGVWSAFKAGAAAFMGFILGTGLKLVCSGVMAWLIVKYAFW
ncbi:MAG: DUF456 domain-containing protein [Bacteroidales bacterium]|nr:DUF456 domain-containing protein [Bacteroidales bacterium]